MWWKTKSYNWGIYILVYTGFRGGLEHLKIIWETMLIDKRFESVLREYMMDTQHILSLWENMYWYTSYTHFTSMMRAYTHIHRRGYVTHIQRSSGYSMIHFMSSSPSPYRRQGYVYYMLLYRSWLYHYRQRKCFSTLRNSTTDTVISKSFFRSMVTIRTTGEPVLAFLFVGPL